MKNISQHIAVAHFPCQDMHLSFLWFLPEIFMWNASCIALVKAWSSRTCATQNRPCQGQPKTKSPPVQHHIQSLARYQDQLKAQMCTTLCGGILAPKQLSTVKYGGGSFVVCAWLLQHRGSVIHEGKHEHFHPSMNCDVVKQSMIPFLHKLSCVVFFNMIMAPNTPPSRQLPSWGNQR